MTKKECIHRFKTVKKGKVYQCRKCGKVNHVKKERS